MIKSVFDWLWRNPHQASREDLQLRSFFTNVEGLLETFTNQLTAKTPLKRLMIIHGVGGVGKSTLLEMFRLLCKENRIAVGMASGGESVNEIQVLQTFADNLAEYGITLSAFKRTLKKHRTIQAKVIREAQSVGESVSEAVNKLAEQYGIPAAGPIAGAGAALAIDWLHGFLTKPDLELLLHPAEKLTHDFLNDLTSTARLRRLVLMIDHFEKMTALDSWTCNLAHQLPSNVLLVIVGREPPGPAWERSWPGWMNQAHIEELTHMSEENMRVLVRRYYFTIKGGEPDPSQADEIIKFARGLPLVVTTTVGLWVKYGLKDFRTIKPQVLADLADRIMEGVTDNLRPLLEAAAAVRWFNKDVLHAVTGQIVDDETYAELRNFELMRTRAEGPFMHDVMREIIDENLKTKDPTRHRHFHEAAALYFERRTRNARRNQEEQLLLEQMYHTVQADEERGVKFFRKLAEAMSQAGLLRQLRTLVAEITEQTLISPANRLWIEYYAARVLHLEARFHEAELAYQSISINDDAEDLLKAYSLCDLGNILTRWERLGQTDGPAKASDTLDRALSSATVDMHLSSGQFDLARVYEYEGNWDQAIAHVEEAYQFYAAKKDTLGMVYANNSLLAAHALRGDWRRMIPAQKASLDLLLTLPNYPYLRAKTIGYWSWAWSMAGRCAEAETNLKESLKFIRHVGDVITLPTYLRNLGLSLGMQQRYGEAYVHIDESLKLAKELGPDFIENGATSLNVLGMLLTKQGNYARAKECLDESFKVKMRVKDNLGISEALVWQGTLFEAQRELSQAHDVYLRSLEWKWTGQQYYETAALIGLCRVKFQEGDFNGLTPLMREARHLADDNEYYDHLSSLHLVQGDFVWAGGLSEQGADFDAAYKAYCQALVYALHYNRFLLDNTLNSILNHCRDRGGEGQRMLRVLRDYWSEGRNHEDHRRDSISPLPEGISLLQAENIARKREPGNRGRQETVTQKLDKGVRSS